MNYKTLAMTLLLGMTAYSGLAQAKEGQHEGNHTSQMGGMKGHDMSQMGEMKGHDMSQMGEMKGHDMSQMGEMKGHDMTQMGDKKGHDIAPVGGIVMTKGAITRLDTTNGRVGIKHEDIENLNMPAMTMSFVPADPALLSGLAVGDAVLFHAESQDGKLTLTKLIKQ